MHNRFAYIRGALLALLVLSGPVSGASDINLPVERIGANDLLSVSVYGAPELTRDVRVTSDGLLRLPLVSGPVQVIGLLPTEVEKAISERLVKDKLFIDPVVTVAVAEYRSRTITVAGAVKRPLTFQQTGAVRLLDALVRADGPGPDAGPDVLVIRPEQTGAPGATPARRVSLRRLLDGVAEDNIVLQPGDEVRVPASEKVFIFGNVRKAGAVRYEDAGEMTVRKVLALSEGLMPYAGRTAWLYRRSDGGTTELPVELSKIIERKAKDVQMLPGDVLYVPDNKGRRLTMSTLERMTAFGTGTASGMLIWRR